MRVSGGVTQLKDEELCTLQLEIYNLRTMTGLTMGGDWGLIWRHPPPPAIGINFYDQVLPHLFIINFSYAGTGSPLLN